VFSGVGAKQALRIDKHLKDLERQLEALQAKGVRPRVTLLPEGAAQLVLAEPHKSLVRTATVTREEVQLLLQHPAGKWALEEALGRIAQGRRSRICRKREFRSCSGPLKPPHRARNKSKMIAIAA